jgi:crotonobetainyl-CoA:carnitine CoA-transferase CaiB-like acyl-CoA transferase
MVEEKGFMTQQALAGLKIVELSQGVAAPYLGKLFADFGASFIKLEPPRRGDAG